MAHPRRKILLVQLPIPQPGLEPARGNVPLAAGYLKMHAESQGLDADYEIEILPTPIANTLGDCGLVDAILEREPWLVGFTCYLWNIDRTLWIAERIKRRAGHVKIIVGGPEVTADNLWVLKHPGIDFSAIGEGEQTFSELLQALREEETPSRAIHGLYVSPRAVTTTATSVADADSGALGTLPFFRAPLPKLDEVSSPYLEGILDAADERMLLLETIRGCIFKCKFCYYPKSYDDLYFLSREKIVANLRHAREHGAREVVLLDPTLNQRKDFPGFLKLLAECNPAPQFTYFGELRAEGINSEIAALLRAANFTEVEIGLQSIDPLAQELMDRKNNLRAFERGARALLEQGIKVKIDLIIGLPGDTVDSIRRGISYLRDSGLYTQVQVFNLAILPGTAFRQEAEQLGLEFQSRPPYYALRTPTLEIQDLYGLMQEAEEMFETEFDPLPPPEIQLSDADLGMPGLVREWSIDLDLPESDRDPEPPASRRAQAFSLRLRAHELRRHAREMTGIVSRLLDDNPHSTLQVVLEPLAEPQAVTVELLEALRRACFSTTSYLDRFYSMAPGRTKGAKRIVVLLPYSARSALGAEWIERIGEYAALAWQGAPESRSEHPADSSQELEEHEFMIV